jgi:hypothetical protein
MCQRISATSVLYQLGMLCCCTTTFSAGEFSTWKPGDDPLKGLELPCMGDVLAAPNHDPLGIWQHNELWWTHDHVGGAESKISNFLTPQHYQTKKSEMTGKMFG